MMATPLPDPVASFEAHRRHLTGLAYRMLGSRAEAEDMVQDAYLRWHAADRASVDNVRAFLSTLVTRLCLDQLKSARVRRESYVGPWLPEPVLDAREMAADAVNEYADDVSFALMMTLDRLSPLERAAFLLHDVFDMSFAEVARALGRAEPTCRKLAARARAHVRASRPRFRPTPAEHERLAAAFVAAAVSGDTAALARMLADDAVLYGDGGGRVAAGLKPIRGADKIIRLVESLRAKGEYPADLHARPAEVNGLPGFVFATATGPIQTLALDIEAGRIRAIYVVRNPDKLRGLPA